MNQQPSFTFQNFVKLNFRIFHSFDYHPQLEQLFSSVVSNPSSVSEAFHYLKMKYFLLFVLLKVIGGSELICSFYNLTYWGYTCAILNQTVAEQSVVQFNVDTIDEGKSSDDVDCVEFFDSRIDFVPAEIFTTFKSVSRLILSNNEFTRWQKSYLIGGANLKAFVLADNFLESLEDGSFELSPELETLALYNNQITEIGSNAFRGLRYLRVLQLNENSLEYVNEKSFNGLDSLKELFLNDNDLPMLPLKVFHKNRKLSELRLDGNKFITIADGVFDRDSNIESLNLTNNLIFSIDAAVLPKRLKVIYVGKVS